MIKLSNLDVGYGKKIIINDITISINRGEILTLIGPNGSGKSTVLKTITKQLRELGGVIYINENDMSKMKDSDVAKTISMVMTERVKTDMMTCYDVIATGRYPYTGRFGILSDTDKEIIVSSMKAVNVTELADMSFMEISDGQRQRVMLGRALCQEPEILVLDEPTSFLDLKYRLDILNTIRKIAKQKNISVIMSLHELDMAMKISDYVACVKDGHIDRLGTPDTVFEKAYINDLFGIEVGNYDPVLGIIHLPKEEGKPKAFVIGGNSIKEYNILHNRGVSFCAGILYDNEIDYYYAKEMTDYIFCAKAFCDVDKELIELAKKCIDECDVVVCACEQFGKYNTANKILFDYAKEQGKIGDISKL